jgi:hypothetical protein
VLRALCVLYTIDGIDFHFASSWQQHRRRRIELQLTILPNVVIQLLCRAHSISLSRTLRPALSGCDVMSLLPERCPSDALDGIAEVPLAPLQEVQADKG